MRHSKDVQNIENYQPLSRGGKNNCFIDQQTDAALPLSVEEIGFLGRIAYGITSVVIAISSSGCADQVLAQPPSSGDRTEEAAKAAEATANKYPLPTGVEQVVTRPTGVPNVPPEKFFDPTSSPSPQRPTEIPQTSEITIHEISTAVETQQLLNKLQQNPDVFRLTSGSDLKHNEKGQLVDMWGRVNMVELIPAFVNIENQNILIVRHPEQNLKTGEIMQKSYLIVGKKDGGYIEPSQANPAQIIALPISNNGNVYYIEDPNFPSRVVEIARITDEVINITSPFGGDFKLEKSDVKSHGLLGVLNYSEYPLLPLDQVYLHIDNTKATPEYPVLGNPNNKLNLPFLEGPEWVYGGLLARSVEYYLQVEHPELVREVLNKKAETSFILRKSNSGEPYLMYTWDQNISPILTVNFFNFKFNNIVGQDNQSGFVQVVPDKSKRGWGMFIYTGPPTEPNYAFAPISMPNQFINFHENDQLLQAAAVQLTDPKNPNYGVIPPIFNHSYVNQGIPK